MKITTWNVNGLRKLRPLEKVFNELDSDIICIQETRISCENDTSELESVAFVSGYHSFFSISQSRSGYSGVATYCRKQSATPIFAHEGFNHNEMNNEICNIPIHGECTRIMEKTNSSSSFSCACEGDGYTKKTLDIALEEGRILVTDHIDFVLINVYIPAVSTGEERIKFKQCFLHALAAKINVLKRKGRHVIIAGDMNICPARIDSAERMTRFSTIDLHSEYKSSSRVWLRHILRCCTKNDDNNDEYHVEKHGGFIDAFRSKHPYRTGAYTCWSEATQGRCLNYGIRIDLIVVDKKLFNTCVKSSDIMPHILGSDHCPVFINVDIDNNEWKKTNGKSKSTMNSMTRRPPALCTQFNRRFAKRQQSITRFLSEHHVKSMISSSNVVHNDNNDDDIPPVPDSPPSSLSSYTCSKLKLGLPTTTKTISKKGKARSSLKPLLSMKSMKTDNRCKDKVEEMIGRSRSFEIDNEKKQKRREESAEKWRKLLSGGASAPLCHHGKTSVLKTVRKNGENKGKRFFSCAYPHGVGTKSNCNFFEWESYGNGKHDKDGRDGRDGRDGSKKDQT